MWEVTRRGSFYYEGILYDDVKGYILILYVLDLKHIDFLYQVLSCIKVYSLALLENRESAKEVYIGIGLLLPMEITFAGEAITVTHRWSCQRTTSVSNSLGHWDQRFTS